MANALRFLSILGLGLVLYWSLSGYLWVAKDFFPVLLSLPLLIFVKPEKTASYLFSLIAFSALFLSALYPARTLHFFCLLASLFYLLSLQIGRIAALPLFAMFLVSPLIKNVGLVFGFPIRLQLTQWASTVLRIVGFDVHAQGNLIQTHSKNFSVDPACMGLSMLHISLFFVFFSYALLWRKTGKKLHFSYILGFLGLSLLLNLFFNLIRIITLVLMNWQANTWMHEAVGLLGVLLYVFLPLWFLIRFSIVRFGKTSAWQALQKSHFTKKNKTFSKPQIATVLGLSLGILWLISQVSSVKNGNTPIVNTFELPILQKEKFVKKLGQHGLNSYQSDSLLVYTKPLLGFFSSEHTPLICWEGSGYRFTETSEQKTAKGQTYFLGKLTKGTDVLYTAWWYANGEIQTNSQWIWRRTALQGSPNFYLINVTAENADYLELIVPEFLH